MTFQSNMELLEAVEALQMSLVSSQNEQANALLVKGMSSSNGLIDGWIKLLTAFDLVEEQFSTTLTQAQCQALNKIQSSIKELVHRS